MWFKVPLSHLTTIKPVYTGLFERQLCKLCDKRAYRITAFNNLITPTLVRIVCLFCAAFRTTIEKQKDQDWIKGPSLQVSTDQMLLFKLILMPWMLQEEILKVSHSLKHIWRHSNTSEKIAHSTLSNVWQCASGAYCIFFSSQTITVSKFRQLDYLL